MCKRVIILAIYIWWWPFRGCMLLYPRVMGKNGSSTLITSTQSQQSDAVSKFCHFGIAAATIQIKSKKECAAAIHKKKRLWFRSSLEGGAS